MDPLDALLGLERLGIKFGLENIRTLCTALDHPQDAYRTVVIAGTNGKGSVAAMVDCGLSAAGFRTGRYTSPHLVRLEERFTLDGQSVATDTLRVVAGDVLAVAQRLRSTGMLPTEPTFFEVATAVALELFRRARVDLAVLEVGMGGRFDATNVSTPLAAAITTIDFDHETFLGHTLAEIAFEKAGIIKPGMIVVVGETKPEAVGVIARVCREQGARIVMAVEGVSWVATLRDGRTTLDLETPTHRYGPIPLALTGRHQAVNAIVAARLLEALDGPAYPIPIEAIVTGLTRAQWPGRLELVAVDDRRRVLFDSAHNPAGARSLAEYLREAFPQGLPMVLGIMRDKNVAGILAALAPRATRFIFTAAHTTRAASPDALAHVAQHAGGTVPFEIEPDPARALARAWESGPTAVVAGSIYLVGELRSLVSPKALC
jgi:dihydrofolate synthase / folylpolyglutamate synthase